MRLEEWNGALLRLLRERADPSRLVYLYVDREVLGDLSELPPSEAVSDFCHAFAATAGERPFRRGAESALAWRRGGFVGDPPFVSHLAMTVLAVTEDPVGAVHGVYRRQNQLLGRPADAAEPPGYGQDVPLLWRTWNRWLDGPGAVLGRPSAHEHPHWTRQGWARSQALVRYQDRLLIERFLEDLGAGAGDAGDGALTVEVFCQWLRYRGPAADRLLQKVNAGADAARSVVRDVLDDEAQRWREQGARHRPVGYRRGLLCYDPFAREFGGIVRVDPTWRGCPLNLGAGEPYLPDAFDPYLRIWPTVSPERLLRDGVDHPLTEAVKVRLGGERVYALRDDVNLGMRVQATGPSPVGSCHILTHRSAVDEVLVAVHAAGTASDPRDSGVPGWLWLDDVCLDRDQTRLRVLGLGAMLPRPCDTPELEDGLRVAANTYLVGGEPDLVLPSGSAGPVTLDDMPVPAVAAQTRVPLADLFPDPGEHVVSDVRGQQRFRTVSFLREAAAGGGVGRPVVDRDGVVRVGAAVRGPSGNCVVAGALLTGIDVPQPLVLRWIGDAELIVLTEDGEVAEVFPQTPSWLARLGIEPGFVDVLDAVRETVTPLAFAVARRNQHRRGVAIPAGTRQMPGRGRCRPRPDLVRELVADRWRWAGPPDDRRAGRVLSRAMAWARESRRAERASAAAAMRSVGPRRDVTAEGMRNPYDDLLTWLSEKEHGRVAEPELAGVWAWLCRRYGMPERADQWRDAVWTLAVLGHLERDPRRRQVAVAPAALVALPSAAGLSVLCGARPVQLLERMNDPDDNDDRVAAASASWLVHRRTPVDGAGRPTGPEAVYVEWDRATRDVVEAGLDRLGVTVTGCASDALLARLPSLQQTLEAAEVLEASPGREVRRWQPASGTWLRVGSDAGPGLYRYLLAHGGTAFAYRRAADAPLVRVSGVDGRWLARAEAETTAVLPHNVTARTLLAPAGDKLPPLLARALVLRTGLPPYLGSIAGHSYLVYENVAWPAAERAAELLRHRLAMEERPVRIPR